jgi:hypothetical protein
MPRRQVVLRSTDPQVIAETRHTIERIGQSAPLAAGLTLVEESERMYLEAPTAEALDFGVWAALKEGYIAGAADADVDA